jgi:hypothetical protein
MARRHVRDGERRLARQEAFVRGMGPSSSVADLARVLLDAVRERLAIARSDLKRLERHAGHELSAHWRTAGSATPGPAPAEPRDAGAGRGGLIGSTAPSTVPPPEQQLEHVEHEVGQEEEVHGAVPFRTGLPKSSHRRSRNFMPALSAGFEYGSAAGPEIGGQPGVPNAAPGRLRSGPDLLPQSWSVT